jgi:Fe-S cluster biosynthesis and repair protein YggX
VSEVSCARCGSTAEGLARPPLPGEVGRRVQAAACRRCWEEWLRMQVMLINEQRLRPGEPEHYAKLVREMHAFLRLDEEGS